MHQSFGMQSTSVSPPIIYICTTGLSKIERDLFVLPEHVILQNELDTATHYLVTYKFKGTEKYLQALKWGIPIVSVAFMYDLLAHYKKYELLPYEGALFTTSAVSESIYANYFGLLRAKYQPNASVFLDFCIGDDDTTDKVRFCKKYGIPVISTRKAFGCEYQLFQRSARADAKELSPAGLFTGKVFFLDSNLPPVLFNKLKKLIIMNEGTRVSSLSQDFQYILTLDYSAFPEYENKLHYHQYVFDCVEHNALLYPEFYKVHMTARKRILDDITCAVDEALGLEAVHYANKLRALSAVVKPAQDMRTTHYISPGVASTEPSAKHMGLQTILPAWVDQCLGMLKHAKESRFQNRPSSLSLTKRLSQRNSRKEIIFQFTGMSQEALATAVKHCAKHGIKYDLGNEFKGCTHLIMGELRASEKFFLAIASGRWILKPGVLDTFVNQAGFDFAPFEWAAEDWMDDKQRRQAKCISKWRQRVQNAKNPPFRKWIVKIYAPDEKRSRYCKLIELGGGTITTSTDYTHVFVDKNYKGTVEEAKKLSTDYLFSYLLR